MRRALQARRPFQGRMEESAFMHVWKLCALKPVEEVDASEGKSDCRIPKSYSPGRFPTAGTILDGEGDHALPNRRVCVSTSATPVAGRPLSDWNFRMASTVLSPYTPSAGLPWVAVLEWPSR